VVTKRKSSKKVIVRASKSGADSLASRAYERIRNEILQGSLAVGDILSRRRLADRFNMSFLPITEALQRLEAQGLVESQPRIGTRVRIPTRQDILDSYVIREALEAQAARLCCEQITTVEREQLIQSARHLDKLYRASAIEDYGSRLLFSVHTYHMQFHMRIAELSRSPGLLIAIEREQVLVFNWLYDTAAKQRSLPAKFHYDLARALCSGDVMKADITMRNHIRYGLNYVVENVKTLEVSKPWRLKREPRSRGTSHNIRRN
jgi:DNA-binding GntR family transcriptional regulator